MLMIAHKANRNTQMGIGGKSYRLDAHGVLHPQPEGPARREVLQLRWFHLIDVETAEERAAKLEQLSPTPAPEPVPTAAPAAEKPPSDPDVDRFLTMTSAIDAIVSADSYTPIASTTFDQLPERPTDEQLDTPSAALPGFDYSTLSRDDLYEIVKERGIPGMSGKTKAELLAIVMGG